MPKRTRTDHPKARGGNALAFVVALATSFGGLMGVSAGDVMAQPVGEDSDADADPYEEESLAAPADLEPKARHGVGLRLRQVFMPQGAIELFVEKAPSGMSKTGFGLEYVRRKADKEINIGFEYDGLGTDDGYYVENGGDPRQVGTTDFVEFDGLGWYTFDASLIYHKEIASRVALRYGGGIGVGIVTGDILETDALCIDEAAESCAETGPQRDEKQDFWRIYPVFSLLGGLQISPHDDVKINVEFGLRTVLYGGTSVAYFF